MSDIYTVKLKFLLNAKTFFSDPFLGKEANYILFILNKSYQEGKLVKAAYIEFHKSGGKDNQAFLPHRKKLARMIVNFDMAQHGEE